MDGTMKRFRIVGAALVIAGIGFVGVGGYTYLRTADGAKALNTFSAAQDVRLSYNEQGQLVDRGEVAGGQAILDLLQNEWGYTVDPSELNPNDPVVNTASEYMVQMATIAHHTLDSTVKVTLTEPADYKGKHYEPGTYDVAVNGRYYSQFDRLDPLDGPARTMAWSPLAQSLIGELGVGSVTASTLQVGLGIAALAAALGLVFILAGIGLVWAVRPLEAAEKATRPVTAPAAI